MTTCEQLQEEEIHTFLRGPKGKEEASDFTPSPFSIKAAGILTLARWLLGGHKPYHLLSAGFLCKAAILCPTSSSLHYQPVVQQAERAWTRNSGARNQPSALTAGRHRRQAPQAGTAGPGLVPTWASASAFNPQRCPWHLLFSSSAPASL